MAPPLRGDLRAGFMGLVVAVVILGVAMYGIVYLTNQKFAGHQAAPAVQH